MTIYIGNLSAKVTEKDLSKKFEAYGRVTSAMILKDDFSSRPLGFGFVEMPGTRQAKEAVAGLNRKKIKGRVVMVSETKRQGERRKHPCEL